MSDQRITKLAELLLDYSLQIKKGEKIYLEWKGTSTSPLVEELIRGACERGAIPFWVFHDEPFLRAALESTTADQIKGYAKFHTRLMDDMQCYIGINGSDNPFEMTTLSSANTELWTKLYSQPVHTERRIKKTRWCVMRWPSKAMAQMAGVSHKEFTEFYFNVCLVDYKKMSLEMEPLVALMNKTDKVRLVADGTDVSFSIKNIPAIKCDGHLNIPDGEVYTAPVADSINGKIKFNAPALYRGTIFSNITITFKDGVAIDVKCDGNNKLLNEIFNIDKGARRCGEFAIGLNPNIKKPMKDSLFDEKIDGSIHMAMGQCYDNAQNGNKSANHWDLVLIQTPEYGGGEIYFDGKLIRKNGKFVSL